MVIPQTNSKDLWNSFPKNHSFSNLIIQLALLIKLKTSASFRAISKILEILVNNIKLQTRIPTHTTISNWIKKVWLFLLTWTQEITSNWIIIIDETIQIWQDKLLAIYWVKENMLPKDRALNFSDLTPLYHVVQKTSPWEIIGEILSNLEKKIWKIIYAVCDWWGNLKKWLELAQIVRIYDLTHKLAIIIEKIFKNDENYKNLTKEISEHRKKYLQTKEAHLIPSKWRSKSRFQNIDIISWWLIMILNFLSEKWKTKEDIISQEKLSWVLKYKKFWLELNQINQAIKEILKLIKTNLLTQETAYKSLEIIKKVSWKKARNIENELKKYFEETFDLLKWKESILAVSDILESAFWKYKNYISDNSTAWITDLSLIIPCFTSELSKEEINNACEKTTIKDVKDWVTNNIWDTLLKLRREVNQWYKTST